MEYRINPQGIKKIQRRYAIYCCCFIILIIIGVLITDDPHVDDTSIPNIIFDLIILLIIIAGLFIFIHHINRKWKRYRLVITDNNIIRENYGSPLIQIKIAEIKSIQHFNNGDLAIGTNEKALLIPSIIEEMPAIIFHFQNIGFTIEENVQVNFLQKNTNKITFIYWFSVFENFTYDNRIFVLTEGIAVILITLFFLQRRFIQKISTAKIAKGALPFIFVIIILAIHICSKLIAK